MILLWRKTYFRPGRLYLPGYLLQVERRGRGSGINGFGGWAVVVIVADRAAEGLHKVSTRKVSRIIDKKGGPT